MSKIQALITIEKDFRSCSRGGWIKLSKFFAKYGKNESPLLKQSIMWILKA